MRNLFGLLTLAALLLVGCGPDNRDQQNGVNAQIPSPTYCAYNGGYGCSWPGNTYAGYNIQPYPVSNGYYYGWNNGNYSFNGCAYQGTYGGYSYGNGWFPIYYGTYGYACIRTGAIPYGYNPYFFNYGGLQAYQYCSFDRSMNPSSNGGCPSGTQCVPFSGYNSAGFCARY